MHYQHIVVTPPAKAVVASVMVKVLAFVLTIVAPFPNVMSLPLTVKSPVTEASPSTLKSPPTVALPVVVTAPVKAVASVMVKVSPSVLTIVAPLPKLMSLPYG